MNTLTTRTIYGIFVMLLVVTTVLVVKGCDRNGTSHNPAGAQQTFSLKIIGGSVLCEYYSFHCAAPS